MCSRFSSITIVVGLIISVSSLAFYRYIPRYWQYIVQDRSGCATVSFREPNVLVTLQGLSVGNWQTSGYTRVSGIGVQRGEGTIGGVVFARSYSPENAIFLIDKYKIEIKDRGKTIICCGKVFPIKKGMPLVLIVDPQGNVSREEGDKEEKGNQDKDAASP